MAVLAGLLANACASRVATAPADDPITRSLAAETRCEQFLATQDPLRAYEACHGLLSPHGDVLERRLERVLAPVTDRAVRGDTEAARYVMYYERLRYADPAKLAAWRAIGVRRKEAARAQRIARRAGTFAQATDARARLAERYGHWRGQSAHDFVAALRSNGPPIVDATIDNATTLTVTVDRLGLGAVLINQLAMVADAFIVWCDCDGAMVVQAAPYVFDRRPTYLLTYRFDVESGHASPFGVDSGLD